MAEWFTACACSMPHERSWVQPQTSTNACGHICKYLIERLSCHADPYTVSRCCTRRESEDHTSEKAGKGSTLALKPRADVTRNPKQGYQWPHKRIVISNFFLKKWQKPSTHSSVYILKEEIKTWRKRKSTVFLFSKKRVADQKILPFNLPQNKWLNRTY